MNPDQPNYTRYELIAVRVSESATPFQRIKYLRDRSYEGTHRQRGYTNSNRFTISTHVLQFITINIAPTYEHCFFTLLIVVIS